MAAHIRPAVPPHRFPRVTPPVEFSVPHAYVRSRDAMSGQTPPRRSDESWRREVQADARYLDMACRQRWGVTVTMFRAAKYAFYIAVLVFVVYLIEATAMSSLVATAVGVLLISGPEGLELYLVREGYLAERDRTRDRERRADGGEDAEE